MKISKKDITTLNTSVRTDGLQRSIHAPSTGSVRTNTGSTPEYRQHIQSIHTCFYKNL